MPAAQDEGQRAQSNNGSKKQQKKRTSDNGYGRAWREINSGGAKCETLKREYLLPRQQIHQGNSFRIEVHQVDLVPATVLEQLDNRAQRFLKPGPPAEAKNSTMPVKRTEWASGSRNIHPFIACGHKSEAPNRFTPT